MANYYMVAGAYYPAELYHHGIKGQKWGVRRFQNSDGTFTQAGKERYGVKSDKQAVKLAKYQEREYEKAKKMYSREREALTRNNAKLSQKRDAALSNLNTRKAEKLENKIERNNQSIKRGDKISKIVLDDIRNMTVKDMKREQRIRGASIASSILVTGGSLALSPHTGLFLVATPNPGGAVRGSRERRAAKRLGQ